MYEEKNKFIYEIDTNEEGYVVACFVETITTVYKDGAIIAQNRHRDVVDLATQQATIAALQEAPQQQTIAAVEEAPQG